MATVDRKTFFAYVRKAPFGNRLTQDRVEGMELMLSHWERGYQGYDIRFLAYILATAFHETGGLMQPVREGFAKTDAGARRVVANREYGKPVGRHVYYGRGHVQLTWHENYERMSKFLGVDLVNDPDLALDPEISLEILFEGMMRGQSGRGDFAGKALEDYFSKTKDDPEGARRIVNGRDKAKLIASYHYNFLDALNAAMADEAPADVKDDDAKPDGKSLVTDKTVLGALTTAGAGAGATLIAAVQNPYALAAFALIGVGLFLVLTGRIEIKRKAGA